MVGGRGTRWTRRLGVLVAVAAFTIGVASSPASAATSVLNTTGWIPPLWTANNCDGVPSSGIPWKINIWAEPADYAVTEHVDITPPKSCGQRYLRTLVEINDRPFVGQPMYANASTSATQYVHYGNTLGGGRSGQITFTITLVDVGGDVDCLKDYWTATSLDAREVDWSSYTSTSGSC